MGAERSQAPCRPPNPPRGLNTGYPIKGNPSRAASFQETVLQQDRRGLKYPFVVWAKTLEKKGVVEHFPRT